MINGGAATNRLRGLVVHGPLRQLDANSLKSIGSQVSDAFLRKMISPLGVPTLHLELLSPLDVNFQHHDSYPPGFLWAVVRSRRCMQVTHHFPCAPKMPLDWPFNPP